MLKDVKKGILERPKANRAGESNTPREKAMIVGDAGERINDSANHTRQKGQKLRNTRFNVLERFLIRNIGKPWDDVFAEICKNSDPRTLGGSEARERIKSIVTTDCWIQGNQILAHGWRGNAEAVKGLYVHPKTGLLARAL